jgi:hypothetical protein
LSRGRSRVSGTITPFPGAVNATHHREGAGADPLYQIYVKVRLTSPDIPIASVVLEADFADAFPLHVTR